MIDNCSCAIRLTLASERLCLEWKFRNAWCPSREVSHQTVSTVRCTPYNDQCPVFSLSLRCCWIARHIPPLLLFDLIAMWCPFGPSCAVKFNSTNMSACLSMCLSVSLSLSVRPFVRLRALAYQSVSQHWCATSLLFSFHSLSLSF